MNVSLPQLKAFAAVARQKSFTRAAAELGLTQSAISRSVRELEEEIDQRLFDRTTRQVELTDAGEMLSQRICHLVEEVEQTLRDSHGTGKPCEGTVQIATDPVLSSMTLPMWVAGCRKAWPGIGITLRDCSHECVLQRVRSGEVDFGIASNPAPCDDLYCEPLCVDPFQAVLPAGHPLAARESLGWGELGDASVLTLDQSSGIQPAVERALAAYRVRPGSLQVLGHFAAVFGMVAMGLGIGVVPSRAQAAGIAPSAVLRPLRPQVTSNVMLVRRKARSLKPNAAAVWDNLRAQEYERGDYGNQGLLKKVG
ncbi:DNA-binding transcriptional LysR family regulator [Cupriavidus metallidurans]|jgi:DNA-binding transcriptional LysR family regulator|uniref:Transcriptional regulator, LysR family n=1 Tax=Cupriavidus metallidurans (strain ATCC 43123 / DSM 2839 / NBRC 102507 / CH34) TaxID=266264 RepID=Q1LF44_CUPMC|nr:LysR family transcriptional regulator [Cupriavidus metallidurans]ABF11232.1 transcriptional regulator, LysR family [Cupriavidus metallidurans CH34]KWW39276.1 HTH-type transcriptional activator CmpR [Cupriavidus metallidurans]MDE4920496.1 LysR family transcriptional regulator [Cupriavidus metallidurans]QGS33161.1 LysR family transcriptional regulator [Cupriavidus metallidurans]UBM07700.1 LysR family transcriptional regulator [Cupriavidus metallidurans]